MNITPVGKNILVEFKFDKSPSPKNVFAGTVIDVGGEVTKIAAGDTILFTKHVVMSSEEKVTAFVSIDDVVGHAPREQTPEEVRERAVNAKAAEEAKARLAAIDALQAAYVPEKNKRVILDNGDVAYEAMSRNVVLPGEYSSVTFGESVVHRKGFPGFPETDLFSTGPMNNFKPRYMDIDRRFAVAGFFSGSMNNFPNAPSKDFTIPAEAFLEDHPQPEYDVVPRGIPIALEVRNVSNEPCPFRGRIIGTEIVPATAADPVQPTTAPEQSMQNVTIGLEGTAGNRELDAFGR